MISKRLLNFNLRLIFIKARHLFKQNLLLLIVLVFGVAVRFFVIYYINIEPISDYKRYYDLGINLLKTGDFGLHGHPFIFQPPAYPLLLGLVFKVFGASTKIAKFLNVFISVASLFIFALITLKISFNKYSRLAALSIFSLYPCAIGFVPIIGVETLSIFLILTLIYFIVIQKGRFRDVGLGALFFLLGFARAQFLPLIGAYIIYRLFHKNNKVILMLATFIVLCSPYSIRNYLIFDKFIPINANAGYILFINNNSSNSVGGWIPMSKVTVDNEIKIKMNAATKIDLFDGKLDEDEKSFFWNPDVDRFARIEATKWIVSNKLDFLKLGFVRLKRTFLNANSEMLPSIFYNKSQPRAIKHLSNIIYWISILAMVRFLFHKKLGTEIEFLMKSILFFQFIAIFFFEGQGRYFLVIFPIASLAVCLVMDLYLFKNLKET